MTQRLGKYEIQRELGRGAFGTVYLARDTVLDVPRALKVLHPALLADATAIERFQREARLAARLEHPRIVTVHDFGQADDRFYFAMRYMEGGSLKERLAQGPLPWEEVVRIVQEVAEGLAYAHEQGVVHRDLKPGNILFDKQGRAAVGDFGLAKALSGSESSLSLTATGGMIGTPAYMAPELWQGKPATPATDQYALACVVYEMVTGQVLFSGETPAMVMTRHMLHGPRFPEEWPSGAPSGLAEVLKHALATDPEDRYADIAGFAAALRRLVEGKTALGKSVPQEEAALPPLAGLAGRVAKTVRDKAQAGLWDEARQGAEVLAEIDEAQSKLLREWLVSRRLAQMVKEAQAWVDAGEWAKVAQAQEELQRWSRGVGMDWGAWAEMLTKGVEAALQEKQWEKAEEGLRLLETAAPEAGRVWRIRYWEDRGAAAAEAGDWDMVRQAAQQVRTLRSDGEIIKKFEDKANEERESFPSRGKSRKEKAPLPSLALTVTLKDKFKAHLKGGVFCVAFSPDGSWLATSSADSTIRLWELSEKGFQQIFQKPLNDWARSVAFSPMGRFLAAGSWDHAVRLWQIPERRLVKTLEGHTGSVLSVAFSPSGEILASASWDNTIKIWDVSSGRLVKTLEGHIGVVFGLAFSPDGKLLASSSEDKTVRIWQIPDGGLLSVLEGHEDDVNSVAFAPDGRLLASGSRDSTVRLWQITNGSGDLRGILEGHSKSVLSVAFSPDGKFLASGAGDKTIRLWRSASGQLLHVLGRDTKNASSILSVSFSPNGQLLASGSADGAVALWDLSSAGG